MRIYVDELPNSCEECPMCRSGKLKLQRKGRYIETEQCVFGQYKYHTIDDEIDTCPLQSLADYTKQVRKEVIGDLMNILNESQYMNRYNSIDKETLFKVLDQLQGETKCK